MGRGSCGHRIACTMTGMALLGIGGAHVDRLGHVSVEHLPGASNPGRMLATVGGGTFNTLRAAHMRGLAPTGLISARGGDSDGDRIAEAIEAAGLRDHSAVFLDRRSASYTAILDERGDVITGIADMDIYETALPRQLRRRPVRELISAANAVLCDANMPPDGVARVCELATGPVFAMAISPAKAPRLLASAASIDTVFLNRREILALTDESDIGQAVARLAKQGFSRAVITHGADPVLVLENGHVSIISQPKANRIIDVTGAGDALAGATIAALSAGVRLGEAVLNGIAAAQLTLQYPGPVAPALIGPEFEAIRKHIGAHAELVEQGPS